MGCVTEHRTLLGTQLLNCMSLEDRTHTRSYWRIPQHIYTLLFAKTWRLFLLLGIYSNEAESCFIYQHLNLSKHSHYCTHHLLYLSDTLHCFHSLWLLEWTGIISPYSINRLVFLNDRQCFLSGTNWHFKTLFSYIPGFSSTVNALANIE
jgi:hypothetical protein